MHAWDSMYFMCTVHKAHLDISAVKSLCVFIKLHTHGEGKLVIPESAQCFDVELVSILNKHFGLRQGNGDFPCGKVNIYRVRKEHFGHKGSSPIRGCFGAKYPLTRIISGSW